MVPLHGYMSSRAVYYALLATDCVGGVAAIACGFVLGAPVLGALVAVAVTSLWYTFGEYANHRWFYHRGQSILSKVHAYHHREPEHLLGAPFYSIVIAALHGLVASLVVGLPLGLVVGGAILTSHGRQGVVHHAAHGYPHLDVLGKGSALRRHHAIHHAVGTANYGISTTLWDRVLGTYVTSAARRSARTPAGATADSTA